MVAPLQRGSQGRDVQRMQRQPADRGFPIEADGDFELKTGQAAKACQSQNPDKHGQPSGRSPLLQDLKDRGWAHAPRNNCDSKPAGGGVWWRVRAEGWQGHAGLVHQVRDGMLYTVQSNRSPKVEGFSHMMSRLDRLPGFGHIPH